MAATTTGPTDAVMTELADRLRARQDELVARIVERYRSELVDYAASSDEFIEFEVQPVTRVGFVHTLDNIAANRRRPTPAQIDEMRGMLVRRPHQGIPLAAIQAAFRLFTEHIFDELAAAAERDRPEEMEAAVRGGAVIWSLSHDVISVVTQTYLDELEDVRGDREIVSRSLLDVVLAGRPSLPSSVRDARILGVDLIPQNVVIVARASLDDDETGQRPRTLREAAKVVRATLLEHLDHRALVGVREGEVVCVCPAPEPRDVRTIVAAASAAARRLDALGMSVGVGYRHPVAEELPDAYAEAREAAVTAVRLGLRDRALIFDDVLVERLLREADTAGRVIATALGPLREYDQRRRASLVDTLRAYIDANFSITGAARAMHIANNTVLYRLDRICHLTGRDPRDPRDIVFLALSLRLDDKPGD